MPKQAFNLSSIALALVLPFLSMGASTAQAQAKYMGSSVDVVPGPKIGCPAGRRENLDNRVGLLPCIEDYSYAPADPRQPGHKPDNCAGGIVQWAAGNTLCQGAIGNGTHQSNGTAVSSNGNSGSALFQCFDGTWYGPLSGTCVPPVSCPDTGVTWDGADGTCSGALSKSYAGSTAGAFNVQMVTNNKPGQQPDPSNGLTAACQSNGKWQAVSHQCKVLPKGCQPTPVSWGECYGSVGSAQDGQSVNVYDENPSESTNDPGNYSTWLCLDGDWSLMTSQCLALPPVDPPGGGPGDPGGPGGPPPTDPPPLDPPLEVEIPVIMTVVELDGSVVMTTMCGTGSAVYDGNRAPYLKNLWDSGCYAAIPPISNNHCSWSVSSFFNAGSMEYSILVLPNCL